MKLPEIPMIRSKETAEHYIWGQQCEGWHLAQSPSLSVIQERVPPGCSEVMHHHPKAEQFFFILSGTATMLVEHDLVVLKPQQGIHIPAGIRHQLRNDGDEDLHFLVTSTPPAQGDHITAE